MKKIILLLITVLNLLPVNAYEIAFPQEKELTLPYNGIFFVGKVNKKENLWINDVKVQPTKNGSFASTFQLNPGENIFVVTNRKNGDEFSKYTINYSKTNNVDSKLLEFSTQDCKTVVDNVILRKTPEDFGINRLGYLPKNTDLQITGIQNEFSRVYLNPNLSAWVLSKDIIPEQREIATVGEFRGESINSDNFADVYTYKFSKNLPYSVIFDKNMLDISVYNVENRTDEKFNSKLSLKPPYCYSVKMKDGDLNISVPKMNLNNPKIIIDAGHGGKEPGAVGCMSDLEKDMNLKAAKALRRELKSRNYNVLMTRNSDKYVSLKDRVNYTRDKKGVIFVSLHMNSVPESADPNTHKGTETYYYNDFSKLLASSIQGNLTKSLGTRDNGVKQASFAVIRPTEYVGVLVETVFMVNPEDVAIYKSKDYYKKLSQGVTNGIEQYLKNFN